MSEELVKALELAIESCQSKHNSQDYYQEFDEELVHAAKQALAAHKAKYLEDSMQDAKRTVEKWEDWQKRAMGISSILQLCVRMSFINFLRRLEHRKMKVQRHKETRKEFRVSNFHWDVESNGKVFTLSYKAGVLPYYNEFFTLEVKELPILIELLSELNQALTSEEVENEYARN